MSAVIYHVLEALGWFMAAYLAWSFDRRIAALEAQVEALNPEDVPWSAQDAWDAEEAH